MNDLTRLKKMSVTGHASQCDIIKISQHINE